MLIFEGVTSNVRGKNLREFGISDTFCLYELQFPKAKIHNKLKEKKELQLNQSKERFFRIFLTANLELWIIPKWIDPLIKLGIAQILRPGPKPTGRSSPNKGLGCEKKRLLIS